MPDVISAITEDHREVEGLFQQYRTAAAVDEKQAVLDKIRQELAQHAAAEEILVYPAVRRAAGHDQAEQAIDEHQDIKRVLADLEKLDPADGERDVKVTQLERAVAEHVKEEEGEVLPSLSAKLSQDRLNQMGEMFERMKPLLPTHPHPNVPGTAVAQLLAGPLASVADRIRDLISR